MPTKAELYAQMANKVATQLTGSWQEWAGFLTTASRLYKYPFHEQLMIYAQRPDATALQTFITGIDTPFAEGGTAFLRRTFLRFFFLPVSLSFACPYRII